MENFSQFHNQTTPENKDIEDRMYFLIAIGGFSFILLLLLACMLYLFISKRNLQIEFKRYKEEVSRTNRTIHMTKIQHESDDEFSLADPSSDGASITQVPESLSTFKGTKQGSSNSVDATDIVTISNVSNEILPRVSVPVTTDYHKSVSTISSTGLSSNKETGECKGNEYQELSPANLSNYSVTRQGKPVSGGHKINAFNSLEHQETSRNFEPKEKSGNNVKYPERKPKAQNFVDTKSTKEANSGKCDVKEVHMPKSPKLITNDDLEIVRNSNKTTNKADNEDDMSSEGKDSTSVEDFQPKNLYENVEIHSRILDDVLQIDINSDGEELIV